LARKIRDFKELLTVKTDLEQLNPDKEDELTALMERNFGIEVFRIGSSISLESAFPGMEESEIDRLKASLALILIDTFGIHREEVYDLLFADGEPIFWQ